MGCGWRRPEAEKAADDVAAAAEAATIAFAVKQMVGFLEEMDAIPAAPVTTSVADWKARLATVRTFEELGRAAIDLEADVNGLGVGLPTGLLLHTLCCFVSFMHHQKLESLPYGLVDGDHALKRVYLRCGGLKSQLSTCPHS